MPAPRLEEGMGSRLAGLEEGYTWGNCGKRGWKDGEGPVLKCHENQAEASVPFQQLLGNFGAGNRVWRPLARWTGHGTGDKE